MALIEQGILGAFRGKCGNVIGYVRNGVACVRSMPAHYHDRRSVAQLKNRGRFTMVMKMMSVVRPAITMGFRRFASTMTEMNVATRVNYYSLVKEGAAGLAYDYSGLVLCRGNVEGLSGVMVHVSGSSLSVVWDGNGVMGGNEDGVSVVLLNGDRMEMRFFRGVALRGDGSLSVAIPQGWGGEDVHCFVMVSRGEDWSESYYAGGVGSDRIAMLGELSCDEADFEEDMGSEEDCFKSDQSAIKVLSNLGQVGDGEEEDPPNDVGGKVGWNKNHSNI